MVLRTAFTEALSVEHPIALAPMGGSAGGMLAAAASNAGGFGLVGAGRGEPDWLARELALVTDLTTKPWGVGFLTWPIDGEAVARALEFEPAAMMMSFGDPTPYIRQVGDAGAKLILQVTDLDEARQAVDLGADLVIAQGSDAGGHGGENAIGTMSFVPSVIDLASPTPVLAARWHRRRARARGGARAGRGRRPDRHPVPGEP